MSEDSGEVVEVSDFTPISSQADLDRIIGDRVSRTKAKFADYDDLKAKASRFDELEQAKLGEVERERAAREAAEAREAAATAGLLRMTVAAETGVPAALLPSGTEEEMRSAADALIAFKGETSGPRPPKPNPTQGLGSSAHALNGDSLEQALRNKLGI